MLSLFKRMSLIHTLCSAQDDGELKMFTKLFLILA